MIEAGFHQRRLISPYINIGKEKGTFEVGKTGKTYAQQYSQIYYVRLAALLPLLKAQAQRKWTSSKVNFADRILDGKVGQLTCIYGTIYADMEFKPNVLSELASDLQLVRPEPRERYIGGKMTYFLEDDSARIALRFANADLIPERLLLTGVSMALLGSEDEKGDFGVLDYCFAGLDDSKPVESMSMKIDEQGNRGGYIALVSGVNFSPVEATKFDLLSAFLSGNFPVFDGLAGKIARVVFVGDTVGNPSRIDEAGRKKYGVEHARYDFTNLRLLDSRLATLSSSLPVDLMPGPAEPTNATLPQSPLHRGLLPLSSGHSSFQPVMNPHLFEASGVRFLGTSGQNLEDVLRYSGIEGRLQVAEGMLEWRHLAPTAPDTLWCFPFFDRDPFVMTECPDVLFIGNQPAFETKQIERPDGRKILIVLVPKFSETSSIVLVNPSDLSCECITLSTLL